MEMKNCVDHRESYDRLFFVCLIISPLYCVIQCFNILFFFLYWIVELLIFVFFPPKGQVFKNLLILLIFFCNLLQCTSIFKNSSDLKFYYFLFLIMTFNFNCCEYLRLWLFLSTTLALFYSISFQIGVYLLLFSRDSEVQFEFSLLPKRCLMRVYYFPDTRDLKKIFFYYCRSIDIQRYIRFRCTAQ